MSKTAVITGATSGIGEAYARRLAQDGYDLIITGRKREIIEKLAADIVVKYNVKVDVVIAELANDADLKKLTDTIKAKGDIDFLVNNAGYSGIIKHYVERDLVEEEKMVKVHSIVPMRLVHLVLPGMIKKGSGAIVNVASIAAFLPGSSMAVYSSTKAFVKMFTQSILLEVMNKGIKVQALCPGPVKTNFAKEYATPEQYKKMMLDSKPSPPEKIVEISLKDLKKNHWFCIPTFRIRVMTKIFTMMSPGIYYKLVTKMLPLY